jgi:demethylmenaquinone methyltransferase/2-methoxy-6-polyprenyl-1,4-benzoquinol methylase
MLKGIPMEHNQRQTKEQFVHAVFESIAPQYDRMNSILSFGMHKRWRKFAMKKMNVQAGQHAIDLCCGTCDWTISLAKFCQGGHVVGLDFSQLMLDYGAVKVTEQKLDQTIRLVNGNAMELPFPDDSFDHATIGFALRNVPDIQQVLREMQRVVKPGGLIVSLELSKPIVQPLKFLYSIYFKHILPWVANIITRRYQQYKWLPESLVNFPDYKQLERIFCDLGMIDVKTYPLSGGIAALHIGTKVKS